MPAEQRQQRFEHRMSDSEALMWNVEKDPWLNPSGAALNILDRPIDFDHFRQTIRVAVAQLPRLRERVVPAIGRLATPVWVPDAEFDLDFHVRHLRLPEPGTERQLFDLATQLYLEPFDRTRPMWRYVVINGIEGDRSAMWSILHHVVADGIGQLRMAELYENPEPQELPPDDVDLEGIIAQAVDEHEPRQLGGDLGESVFESTVGVMAHLARRQAGRTRRLLDEAATWPRQPSRFLDRVNDIATATSSTVGAVIGSGDNKRAGSPLWVGRSRHRHLECVRISLDDLKRASKRAGVTVNDLFVAGMVEGAVRYHADRDVEVEAFNSSFVLSTRNDQAVGGNEFTPVPVQLGGGQIPLADRVADVSSRLAAKREGMSHGGGMNALAGVANMLPTSVTTRAARARAAHIDFATSNLRSAPFPLYIGTARIEEMVAMGPVAGTACNATVISYDGGFDIGLFVDPVAIEAPADLRAAVDEAFRDICRL